MESLTLSQTGFDKAQEFERCNIDLELRQIPLKIRDHDNVLTRFIISVRKVWVVCERRWYYDILVHGKLILLKLV